ncbi:hypothetical protein Poly24_35310 [Rosistilla carotiformis]|uniref:Uncharacterized protein n=1 Tax=Rosistilla carotiformis TaxID=2528017 RepID=A0A518JWA2_9BACT|nr:hypothetical protein [Rosistilla carotiformis]QDV69814.1 hypothetical protein Poly24_35310 [Rosistilla carotiformis]
MGFFNQIEFVPNQIKSHPRIDEKPVGGIAAFGSHIGAALKLMLKEQEIIFFCLLQWASIGAAYLLWIQIFAWIPEEVWQSAKESDEGSIADVVFLIWSFVCVGLAAFPVGIFTGCMGAAHFLHRQGRESTVASCIRLVLPQSWSLWMFHWLDGWITVRQILRRLPSKDDRRTQAQRAMQESLYYAWKLGVSGILPSIVTGNNLLQSGKNSVVFVKQNFWEVAKLRAGYSAVCWIVGIGTYVGTIWMFAFFDVIPKNEPIESHMFEAYFWIAGPLLIAIGVVMLFLRPVFVLALCDLYSEHLDRRGKSVALPENPPKSISALVAFGCLCLLVAVAFLLRDELGITDMLSTPYGEEYGADKGN